MILDLKCTRSVNIHILSLLIVKYNRILNKKFNLRVEQAKRSFKQTKNLFYFDFFVLKLSVYVISFSHASGGKWKLELLYDEDEFVVIRKDDYLLSLFNDFSIL